MKNLLWVALAGALAVVAPISASATTLQSFQPIFTSETGVRFRSFNNTGGDEVFLGVPDLGIGANRTATNLTWGLGVTGFEYIVNLASGQSSVSVNGGSALTYSFTPTLPNLNALRLTVADRDAGAEAWLTNLVVNGVNVGDVTSATDEGFDEFLVRGLPPGLTTLTVTGDINLSGSFSNSAERSRIEIQAGFAPVPLPAAAWFMIAGLGALITIGHRRRVSIGHS